MRRFLSPRWLALHLLAILAFGGCLAMGWWQLTRAQGGNAISWGYTFEWPVFGVFALVFWGKLIRDERRQHGGAPAAEPVRLRAPVLVRAGRDPQPLLSVDASSPAVTGDDGDGELAAYNRFLAWQAANPRANRRDYPG